VVARLLARRPELRIEGCGGPRMVGAGLALRCDIAELSAIGFLEVVRSVPRHLRLLRELTRDAEAGRYALAVLIDYPGFHMRLGARLRSAGVPVLQYIAPQMWAWRSGRVRRLRRAADRLAVVLPFEQEWFACRGMSSTFVGHPLLDRPWPSRAEARAALDVPPAEPVLGIFPGSREGEISRNWPLFRDVARRMLAEGLCRRAIVAGTAEGYYPEAGPIVVHRAGSETVLAAATAALVKSGTTTLEAACAGTPIVVAYRTPRTTYELARRLMTVQWISLVNLILGEQLVPEFWHLPVAAAPIADALRPLLTAGSREEQTQRAGLARVRERLGSRGAADRVAALALDLLPC
jgi:lipid-A-disaccharide synthase